METSLSIPQARELPREITRSVKLTMKNLVNDIVPFRWTKIYGKDEIELIDTFFN